MPLRLRDVSRPSYDESLLLFVADEEDEAVGELMECGFCLNWVTCSFSSGSFAVSLFMLVDKVDALGDPFIFIKSTEARRRDLRCEAVSVLSSTSLLTDEGWLESVPVEN